MSLQNHTIYRSHSPSSSIIPKVPSSWGDGPWVDFRGLGWDWFRPCWNVGTDPAGDQRPLCIPGLDYGFHLLLPRLQISPLSPALSQRKAMHKSIALCPKRWWAYLEPKGFPEEFMQEDEMHLGSVTDPALWDGKSAPDTHSSWVPAKALWFQESVHLKLSGCPWL